MIKDQEPWIQQSLFIRALRFHLIASDFIQNYFDSFDNQL